MNILMPASYSPGLVVLSYFISVLGAFAALSAASQMHLGDKLTRRLNFAAASVALGGVGIWSMHFVGMLSLQVRMSVSYSMVETLVSLVAAIGGSALALHMLQKNRSLPRLVAAGVVLAIAVCVMHYGGMYGMRFPGYFLWSYGLIAASVLVAVAAGVAGLWMAFTAQGLQARSVASLLIGAAVCAMHYTGMAAADFVCTSPQPYTRITGLGLVSSFDLPMLVITVSLSLATVIVVDQAFQRIGRTARAMRSYG